MQGVVPAGGKGTRLSPLTATQPKGLVEVASQPLLTYCFDALESVAVTELIVIIGTHGDMIRDAYGEHYNDIPITYVHQSEPLGLAHAVLQAEPYIENDFIVMNGDNIIRTNLTSVVDHHRSRHRPDHVTLLVESVPKREARQTGVCELDESGQVISLVEKPEDPPSTLVLTGFFILPQSIFSACRAINQSPRDEYELTDAINQLVQNGTPVEIVQLDGWRINVNTQADIRAAETRLSNN